MNWWHWPGASGSAAGFESRRPALSPGLERGALQLAPVLLCHCSKMTKPPVVALINSSPDVVDMIRITMEHAGMVLVSTMTHEIRDGEVDIEAFLRQHDPQVILYDIAPPYDANWLLFQHISSMPGMQDRRFIITTTNVRHVRALAGKEQRLFEIVGKPYDLQKLAVAVTEALGD